MKPILYHIKRREYLGKTKQGVYGYRPTWGPWIKVACCFTLRDAQEKRADIAKLGMNEYAIFYQGKRVGR